ncbi:MAG: YueI family protein [Halanaerobiaceae bacterium]|nr:YueI family protein [Halanaerobiaceae bacterium]
MRKKRSELEERLLQGIHGKKELKREERNYYLGEFEERVIRYLTREQVLERGIYPEILAALEHPAARRLIVDRAIELNAANKYIKLAGAKGLQFRRVHSPDFKGDVGLVVVSDRAVEVEKREVLSRTERLKEKGISDTIIENPGAKLCEQCWQELKDKAPEELANYRRMSFLDRILGFKCICKEN